MTTPSTPTYAYDTYFEQVPLDHMATAIPAVTFPLRVLSSKKWWQGGKAPIFFYCGNEADISLFAENTGFLWELAEAQGAMVLFAEHRYYGLSLPFGNESLATAAHAQYLSAAQALADFTVVIQAAKTRLGALEAPVVAFGGSYGGMLAAWLRMKYSHVVVGALASSAPIWQFGNLIPSNSFARIVTRDFERAGCASHIQGSWSVLARLAQTAAGRVQIKTAMGMCQVPATAAEVTGAVFNWLVTAFEYMAMADYPYPASFLGTMPGYPVHAACKALLSVTGGGRDVASMSDAVLLAGVAAAAKVYYDSGNTTLCNNILMPSPSPTLGELDGWNYQFCSEMFMPDGQNGGDEDMFSAAPWNATATAKWCADTFWGITPKQGWTIRHFGGHDLRQSSASNVIFSNGDLDPWSGGGVLPNPVSAWRGDGIHVFLIEGGAHHLDLRAANAADPPSVRSVRAKEADIIAAWVKGAQGDHKSGSDCDGTVDGRVSLAVSVVVSLVLITCVSCLIAGLSLYRLYDAGSGGTSPGSPQIEQQQLIPLRGRLSVSEDHEVEEDGRIDVDIHRQ